MQIFIFYALSLISHLRFLGIMHSLSMDWKKKKIGIENDEMNKLIHFENSKDQNWGTKNTIYPILIHHWILVYFLY